MDLNIVFKKKRIGQVTKIDDKRKSQFITVTLCGRMPRCKKNIVAIEPHTLTHSHSHTRK